MMVENDYEFTRAIGSDGRYNIDNFERIDGESNPIHLAHEIETSIPGKSFKVICDATNVKVKYIDCDINASEQTTLATTVSDHKNNV